jgi:hypothetical protein
MPLADLQAIDFYVAPSGDGAQIKDRHLLLTSVCFWGMIWPVATIDASAVRGMNL